MEVGYFQRMRGESEGVTGTKGEASRKASEGIAVRMPAFQPRSHAMVLVQKMLKTKKLKRVLLPAVEESNEEGIEA